MVASPMQLNSLSYTVVVSEKGGAERREMFSVAELSVGRVQGNDLLLPKGNVSKQHAKLLYRDGRFIVTDLNSTNGTYVNRRRIQQATVITEGDRIYIGDFVLRIETSNAEDSASWSGTGEHAGLMPDDGHHPDPIQLAPNNVAAEAVAEHTGRQPVQPEPGRPQLSSVHGGFGEHSAGSQGHTVRTESPFSANSVASSLAEDDPRGLLGALVDSVLAAGDALDFSHVRSAEQREAVERLLDDGVSRLISNGQVLAGAQADRLRLVARNELLELGPLTRLLEDPSTTEVIVPRFDQVLVKKQGQIETCDLGFASPNSFELVIQRLCQHSGVPVSPEERRIERRLTGGAYLCAILAPIATEGPSLFLRRPKPAVASMQTLVRMGAVSRAIATFFQQAMAARLRVLVVGPRDAELGNIVGAMVSTITEGPVLILEGSEDLGIGSSTGSHIRWSTLGSKDSASVVRAASKLAATHVVIALDEPEMVAPAIDMLGAGGAGAVVACIGRSVEAALARLTLEVCMGRPGLNIDTARRLVAGAFDLVIEVVRYRDGRQRVVRLAELGRATSEEIEVDDVFTFVTTSGGSSDVVEGTFKGIGTVPRVVEELIARGVPFDTNLFGRTPAR